MCVCVCICLLLSDDFLSSALSVPMLPAHIVQNQRQRWRRPKKKHRISDSLYCYSSVRLFNKYLNYASVVYSTFSGTVFSLIHFVRKWKIIWEVNWLPYWQNAFGAHQCCLCEYVCVQQASVHSVECHSMDKWNDAKRTGAITATVRGQCTYGRTTPHTYCTSLLIGWHFTTNNIRCPSKRIPHTLTTGTDRTDFRLWRQSANRINRAPQVCIVAHTATVIPFDWHVTRPLTHIIVN